jgi:hypothetical protein
MPRQGLGTGKNSSCSATTTPDSLNKKQNQSTQKRSLVAQEENPDRSELSFSFSLG